jgi:hypothetical protein
MKSKVISVEKQFNLLEAQLFDMIFVKVIFVSKLLHSPTMHIDLATVHVKEVLLHFEKYGDTRFTNYLVKTK